MAGRLQVTLVSVCLLIALCTQSNAQQDGGDTATSTNPTLSPPPPTPDSLIHNLQFSLPIVIVCILLFIMAVIVIVVMRKARYGQFCCLKPKMSFRYIDDDDEERGSTDEQESSQKPPTYKMTDIAPPAYQDALQDALISQQTDASAQEGGPQEGNVEEEKEEMVEVPLEEHETEDDRAPLNP